MKKIDHLTWCFVGIFLFMFKTWWQPMYASRYCSGRDLWRQSTTWDDASSGYFYFCSKLDDNQSIRLDIARVGIWEENRQPERTIHLDIAISGHIYMKTDIFVKRLNISQVGIHEKNWSVQRIKSVRFVPDLHNPVHHVCVELMAAASSSAPSFRSQPKGRTGRSTW